MGICEKSDCDWRTVLEHLMGKFCKNEEIGLLIRARVGRFRARMQDLDLWEPSKSSSSSSFSLVHVPEEDNNKSNNTLSTYLNERTLDTGRSAFLYAIIGSKSSSSFKQKKNLLL